MTVIALDTSARAAARSVLAGEDGALLTSLEEAGPAGGSAPRLLRALIDPDLTALVVVTGPGSFTGVRVGMAAALGVAHALDLPLFGIGALEVIAFGAPPGTEVVVAVSDAGRGGVYLQRFAGRDRDGGPPRSLGPPLRLTREELSISSGEFLAGAGDVAIEGIFEIDHARALAAATVVARRRGPLDRAQIRADHAAGQPVDGVRL